MRNTDQIVTIAKAVRKEMVSFAKAEGSKICYEPRELDCLCAIASDFLVKVAEQFGFEVYLTEGIAFENISRDHPLTEQGNHMWVEWREFIIDITATQFGVREHVYMIGARSTTKYHAVLFGAEAEKSLRNRWPREQRPTAFLKVLEQRTTNVIKDLQKELG